MIRFLLFMQSISILFRSMEKSMIQDLDAMRTSMGYKNTFTTSFHDGGYELKKYVTHHSGPRLAICLATKNPICPCHLLSSSKPWRFRDFLNK